uniref:tRNA(Ile)-lysidine synthase n=1 Tax=Porphyridium sordidum TaxID=28024 RepID=A0A1C9CDS2_PORSO|nr:tRNA(Ile)-lysidine synthase [Porphyridium sordidum]AOM66512.1 tRNA(Ile)-lysidine synthase [Porphyridium sordidum]
MSCILKIMLELHKNNTINKILLSFSGGQDSMCLLKLLSGLPDLIKTDIFTIHFDHEWRLDSQINCVYYCFNSNFAKDDEVSSRKWRYQELILISQALNIQYIATAHTATDKIETVFYNLMRGSGLNGLTSNSEILYLGTGVKIIRPLFHLSRSELSWLTRKYFIPVWTDSTNFDYHLARNKIRNELMPYMKNQFNPKLDQELCRFIEHLIYEFDYIQSKACFLYKIMLHPVKKSLNRKILEKLHPAIKVRILSIFLYPISKNHMTNIIINEIKESVNRNIFIINSKYYLYLGHSWIHILKKA